MLTHEAVAKSNERLEERYAGKLHPNPVLTRTLVSFQGNKNEQGYRWFKFKEGFAATLVRYFLDTLGPVTGNVLDPFAGVGTTLFAASERGLEAVGIEVLPVATEVIEARKAAFATPCKQALADSLQAFVREWANTQPETEFHFPHLRITAGAFPPKTERALCSFITAANKVPDLTVGRLARLCAMCVLEDISYTRKDGQYLRWDSRAGRRHGEKRFHKGELPSFEEAIAAQVRQVCQDITLDPRRDLFTAPATPGKIKVLHGSCLQLLGSLATSSFDFLMTSPPYCNRYDYTRTYALELALLGVGERDIRELRQAILSCTVENRAKPRLATWFDDSLFAQATVAFNQQTTLQTILAYLLQLKQAGQLNNNSIPHMVRNYFWEMTLVIFQLARVLRPRAPLVMVNDNVQYAGVPIPVDLILSDIAETAGFEVDTIWVLPRGKGNSSQQMGAHGRCELRKCVYVWRAPKEKLAN